MDEHSAAVRRQVEPSTPGSYENSPSILAPAAPIARQQRDFRADPSQAKMSLFDPSLKISSLIKDPIYTAIHGKWRDRQAHGRVEYEAMLKHPAVSTPFNTLLSFIKANKPQFRVATRSPTAKQQEIADFANEQLGRLGTDGDFNQGWSKFVNAFVGQGLEFGFSLAEMETAYSKWRGKKMVQIQRILPLPQASLDSGFIPREEFGEIALAVDPRYRCFAVNDNTGKIQSVYQYWAGETATRTVTWTGDQLRYILHYTHNGGDGNPYGESHLYSAFYAWEELYTREQQEGVFMDLALPITVVSYDADVTSPELHGEAESAIENFDPVRRILIGRRITVTSVAPTNKDFVDHVTKNKAELRNYITEAMLMPKNLYTDSQNADVVARNVIQIFFKYTLPGLLEEIGSVIQNQFVRRIIDANYSHLESEDYPIITFKTQLDNDLRVAANLLVQLLPYMDSDRMGEVFESMIPGFEKEWIAKEMSKTVAEKMPVAKAMEPAPVDGQGGKSEGTPDTNKTGQTENIGNKVDTAV